MKSTSGAILRGEGGEVAIAEDGHLSSADSRPARDYYLILKKRKHLHFVYYVKT